jgi:hypothetical protein
VTDAGIGTTLLVCTTTDTKLLLDADEEALATVMVESNVVVLLEVVVCWTCWGALEEAEIALLLFAGAPGVVG